MNSIGEMLRAKRELLSLTQQQVAAKVNISRAYYADVERGRYTPSLKLLSKLGKIMNIDLNFLKENDGNTSIS